MKQFLITHTSFKENRSVFYYRGNLLMAVRSGHYKMHLWTWTTPNEELEKGIDHCPGSYIANVTTTVQVDHQSHPILFHMGRDSGERYPIPRWKPEYKQQVAILREIVSEHQSNLVHGQPQLNWCDIAVMNWAPTGCDDLRDCLPVPASKPYLCTWPH